MRSVGFPVERETAFASRRDVDYLGIEVKTGTAAELGLVVAPANLEVSPFGERRDVGALGLEAPVGYARRQHPYEAGIGASAKHVADRALALRDEAAYDYIALVDGILEAFNDLGYRLGRSDLARNT